MQIGPVFGDATFFLGDNAGMHAWAIATAAVVSAGCALVGTLLVVRRMSLLGDAISHAVLPGIVCRRACRRPARGDARALWCRGRGAGDACARAGAAPGGRAHGGRRPRAWCSRRCSLSACTRLGRCLADRSRSGLRPHGDPRARAVRHGDVRRGGVPAGLFRRRIVLAARGGRPQRRGRSRCSRRSTPTAARAAGLPVAAVDDRPVRGDGPGDRGELRGRGGGSRGGDAGGARGGGGAARPPVALDGQSWPWSLACHRRLPRLSRGVAVQHERRGDDRRRARAEYVAGALAGPGRRRAGPGRRPGLRSRGA